MYTHSRFNYSMYYNFFNTLFSSILCIKGLLKFRLTSKHSYRQRQTERHTKYQIPTALITNSTKITTAVSYLKLIQENIIKRKLSSFSIPDGMSMSARVYQPATNLMPPTPPPSPTKITPPFASRPPAFAADKTARTVENTH